jgi:hypothetical protein
VLYREWIDGFLLLTELYWLVKCVGMKLDGHVARTVGTEMLNLRNRR